MQEKSFFKFIVRDFDVRIGMAEEAEYRIGRFEFAFRNDNGDCLVELLSATRLFFQMETPFSQEE